MLTELEIRNKISEYDAESILWIEDNYMSVVNLLRAHIKGLRYTIGEEYSIPDGIVTGRPQMRSDVEIRNHIKEIEDESQDWIDNESVVRMFRAQIKGMKYALGEDYSISEGK